MTVDPNLHSKLHARFQSVFGPAHNDLYETEQWSLVPTSGQGMINVLLNGTRQGPLVWVFDSQVAQNTARHFAVTEEVQIDELVADLVAQVNSADQPRPAMRHHSVFADVQTTAQLAQRPTRSPGYVAENDALLALSQCMARDPKSILQMTVDTAMKLCRGESAGLSILEIHEGREIFRWHATAGAFGPNVGDIMPRNSPCGAVIDRDALLMFHRPELHFEFPGPVDPPIEEVILAPFHVNGAPAGTLWVISHNVGRKFDREDVRLLSDLSIFASAAHQVVTALELSEAAQLQITGARDCLAIHGDELEALIVERTAELAESNRRLVLAERMVAMGTLSAGLGHDMGNMVLMMRTRLEAIQKNAATVNEHSQVLGDCVTYIQNLASGLRLMALNPRDKRLGPERVSLASWWDAAHRVLACGVTMGIYVESRIAPNLPDVSVNRAGLTQAVYNLVQNAVDSMKDRRGCITIAAALDGSGSRVLLSVTDEGPGMTDEVRQHCLEAYYSTKTSGTSSGLGLALVQNVVATAGGKITIESVLGKGTSFILALPVAEPAGV